MLNKREKDLLIGNPDLFLLKYFPHRLSALPGEKPQLKDFHLRLIDTASKESRGLILYPAGHGKPLPKQTTVLMADGSRRAIGDLIIGDRVISGCGDPDTVSATFEQGLLPTFRITTASGREVEAAADHSFLTPTGFLEVQHLEVGMALANVSAPKLDGHSVRSDAEFRLAGYFVGDGHCKVHGVSLASNITNYDLGVVNDLHDIADTLGFTIGNDKHPGRIAINGGCRPWLRDVGLAGKGSHDKRVPDFVFTGSNDQVAQFIGAYFACDGNINQYGGKRRDACCEFYSVCKDLLSDIQHLLLRFGIQSNLRVKNGRYKGEAHKSWRLSVSSQDDIARFAERIPVPGEKSDKIKKWCYERSRFDENLLGDQIVSIDDAGEQECVCITVERDHTYTANDLVTHNTTIVSTLLPIYDLCVDPNVRVLVILKNDTDAQGVGQAIQAELLGNKELIEDFGPFQPEQGSGKPWGVGKMSVQNRTRMGKEPTIALVGAGSRTALGHRADHVICDDIIHDQNSSTPEQQDKIREWFNQGPATAGEYMDSRLTVVGTRFHPADLYQDLIDLGSYKVQREDAVVDEEMETTLWPERWPWMRLMERKLEMGTIDFNKRYRNIPVDRSRMAFREEWIRGGSLMGVRFKGCLDRNYKVGEYESDWWRYAAFDPAIGVTRSRKFCAHILLAAGSCKDHERCFWIVDVERDQMTLPQQVDLIIRKHQEHDLFRTVVEANSYQAGLHQAIVQKMDDQGLALRIDPHYTTRVNKPDPEMGVLSMGRYFENGQFHIPWGDNYSQRKMTQLVDELIQYPGKYTDTVLGLWFAWRAAQEQGARYNSTNYLKKAAPRWEKRTNRRIVKNPYYIKN